MSLIFEEETYAIRGAVFEVYKEMGCGFLEAVYQECLEKELRIRSIPFVAQQELSLMYKGEPLQQMYKPDLICHDQIILELKAVKELADIHFAQLRSYLKATGMKVGLLLNFSKPTLEVRRVVN